MGNQAYGELGQGRSSGSSGAGGGAGQGLQVGMEGSCFGVSDGPFGAWHGHEQWGRGFPCCMATWLIFFLWRPLCKLYQLPADRLLTVSCS